jgi:hypothetical protein
MRPHFCGEFFVAARTEGDAGKGLCIAIYGKGQQQDDQANSHGWFETAIKSRQGGRDFSIPLIENALKNTHC